MASSAAVSVPRTVPAGKTPEPSPAAVAFVIGHGAPGMDHPAYTYAGPAPILAPGIDPYGAQGIDIAQVNETWNPAASIHQTDFAIFKVSEGIAPYKFDTFYQSAQTVGTPLLGAYHFIRPEWSTGDQVKNFLNQVQGRNFGFYAVDVEDSPIHKVTPGIAQQARDFMQQVNAATGKPVLLYTNESTLTKFFNKPADAALPLWISDPDPQPRPDSGGRPWVIWQYSYNAKAKEWGTRTSNVNIETQGVDVNRAHGSLADLVAQLQAIGAAGNKIGGQ